MYLAKILHKPHYLQQQEAVKVQIECGMQGGLAYACPAFGSYAELVKMTSGTKRWKTHIKSLKKNKSPGHHQILPAKRPRRTPRPTPKTSFKEFTPILLAPGTVVAWTDGSCYGARTPRANAGCGVHFEQGICPDISIPLPGKSQTNNRAELWASLVAQEAIEGLKPGPLLIYTDSTYLTKGIRDMPVWYELGWKTRSGRELRNADRWAALHAQGGKRSSAGWRVRHRHVYAHVGTDGNETADGLAKRGAKLRDPALVNQRADRAV
jgi:ribonuclease HI